MYDTLIRVLMIDDDEDDFRIVNDLLSEVPGATFKVDWAGSYEKGLDAIATDCYDVHLVDYRLGEHDGLELIRKVLKCDHGHTAPCILLTGQGDHEVDIAATKTGAADYLTKESLDPYQLERSIRYAVERHRASRRQNELQQKLERARRMESLGALAGGVAHDLNNMLGPLVAYPELILMSLDENSPIRADVERIGKAATDAANVIQDLLTLARRGRYEMEPLDLVQTVKDYLESPSARDTRKRKPEVDLIVNLPEDPTIIMGSPTHLSKAIMNLFVNAFDAIEVSGTVTLTVSRRHITQLSSGFSRVEPGDYVMLEISDSGVGIPPENISKVFEPYYSTKTMGRSGSGLGLSVVYGIVKDHKGYYDILSDVGQGTQFQLFFPECEENTRETAPDLSNCNGNESILVVDDVEDQRRLAKRLLSSFGYDVYTVVSGEEALKFIQRRAVDIVVIDMVLQGDFDGLDTYRHILKLYPQQKAVIVSGFSKTERVEEMKQIGAGAYIRKPYTRRTIGKAVRDELDRQPTGVTI